MSNWLVDKLIPSIMRSEVKKSSVPEGLWHKCPACDDPWGEIQDAEACCEGSVAGQPMQCPICLKGAESFEDAADCCLHVHPTMTALGRQRVAQAVAGGIPWPDAVAANIHH